MSEEFILAQDNDGHWYVIPDDKNEEFYRWVDDEGNWDIPEYAKEVGGAPSLVKFTGFRID